MSISQNPVPPNIKLYLISFQALLYIIVCIFCLKKIVTSWRSNAQFIKYFYIAVSIYILCELVLQAYQIVHLYRQCNEQGILNIHEVIAINTFCIIADIYLIAMLSEYWKSIEMEFRKQALNSYEQVQYSPHRCSGIFLPCHIWTLLYIAIYVYLNVTGIYRNELNSNLLWRLLYYFSQGVSALLILIYIVIQTWRGMTLLKTLKKYQLLIAFSMNKGRFLLIFWMTSVVNVARIAFFMGLIICYAQISTFNEIWLQMYIFTLTAIFPILFYLCGFKVKDASEDNSSVIPQCSVDPRKSEHSSYHETELAESF